MELVTWAQGIYLLTSIFGVGVTLVDMLGVLGSDDTDADGDFDIGETDSLDFDDVSVGDEVGTEIGQLGGDVDAEISEGELMDADATPSSQDSAFAASFVILTYLRRAVYFSLGFGPVGLVALGTGSSVLESLAWAVPCGIASAFLAGWVLKFQRSDVDSSVSGRDLFFQRALVLVAISPGGMGKVRVAVGQSVVDRYARAEKPGESFGKGEEVCITRVAQDCVYVEKFSVETPKLTN